MYLFLNVNVNDMPLILIWEIGKVIRNQSSHVQAHDEHWLNIALSSIKHGS